MDNLSQGMDRLRARMRSWAGTAGRQPRDGRTTRIDVAGRTNVVRSVNANSPGSTRIASATQHAPIHQRTDATDAER